MFCSLVATDHTCTKAFLTHGFVVDEKGYKMSKSAGNGIAPREILDEFNGDILRMWVSGHASFTLCPGQKRCRLTNLPTQVCSTDYTGDVVLSRKLLKALADDYRKLRSTMRFLLQNVADFDSKKVLPRTC